MTISDFKEFWLPHKNLYFKTAFMILKESAEADDALQDLFVKLWNARESLEGIRSPQAYGVRLIRNICIDRLRRTDNHQSETVNEQTEAISSSEADKMAISRDIAKAVEKGIKKLNEQQKKVFRMRFIDGINYESIEKATGLCHGNIRVITNRARAIVMEVMKNEGV